MGINNKKAFMHHLGFLFCLVLLSSIYSINVKAGLYSAYSQKTNIPTLYIETIDGGGIDSKEFYKYCRLILVDNDKIINYDSAQIRGRGNASWLNFEKKPYRIKFKKKERFLGKDYAKAKNWVLLSNGGEKLLFRNGLANYVSKLCNMPFTPASVYVDLYLNGNYQGNYQISDFIDIREKRIEVYEQDTIVNDVSTDITGGYLFEVDGMEEQGETYITTPVFENTIRIHSPKPEVISQRQIDYIYNHLKKFEEELICINPSSPYNNYRHYVDSASLMGWYLTNEICANSDVFWQIYFFKERDDDKLYFGPVWDFDLGFNGDTRRGDNGDVSELLMAEIEFGKPFFQEWFNTIRKDKWWIISQYEAYHKLYKELNLDSCMLTYVDSIVTTMKASIDENYKIWGISKPLHPIRDYRLYDNYDHYVDDLRAFIIKHNAYIYRRFEEMYNDVACVVWKKDIPRSEQETTPLYYSIDGIRRQSMRKGFNIIIYPDGRIIKRISK